MFDLGYLFCCYLLAAEIFSLVLESFVISVHVAYVSEGSKLSGNDLQKKRIYQNVISWSVQLLRADAKSNPSFSTDLHLSILKCNCRSNYDNIGPRFKKLSFVILEGYNKNIISQFCQIGKDSYWNGDRLSKNNEKLPYLHRITGPRAYKQGIMSSVGTKAPQLWS